MKRFLNLRFLSALGVIGIIFIASQAFIYYGFYSDTKLARAVEDSRYLIDSIDGEIENPNNPEVTVENISNSSSTNSSSESPNVITQKRNGPDRLIINKIGINAYIQYVGIARSGNIAVPTNFQDVGWYKLGPKPGEKGNAIISGHLDNALGRPGVFYNLKTLAIGDTIKVQNSDGKIIQFKVTKKESYAYTDNASEIFREDGKSRLVLITCSGKWIQSEKSYDSRLVVFAELI
jgi:LPXTG-site transpeptidase (sortase) family protein